MFLKNLTTVCDKLFKKTKEILRELGDFMNQETRIEDFETILNLFTSKGIDKNLAKSILVKLWFLFKLDEIPITNDNQEVTLQELYNYCDEPWVELIHELEYFKTSGIKLYSNDILKVKEYFTNRFNRFPMSYIRGRQLLRDEGFFVTPDWIDYSITNQVKNNLTKWDKFSVIDFSAGLGDFLKPFLKYDKARNYAIELDPHTYEVMIFDFLVNPSVSVYQKCKLLLTVKQGDSLFGYQRNKLDELIKEPKNKELMLSYLNVRLSILDIESKNIVKKVKECFKLRKEISAIKSNYSNFNWFIDFPELFLDPCGDELKNPGVDYVIGNPPWIGYSKINTKIYNEILNIEEFSDLIQGKFNFYLPFAILAFNLTKKIGGLVLPQSILTESYSQKFREYIFQTKTIFGIKLYGAKGFHKVINEFCTIVWNKEEKSEVIDLAYFKSNNKLKIHYKAIEAPFYRLPLFPTFRIFEIIDIKRNFKKIGDYINIRRGLTLTRKYQKKYNETEVDESDKFCKKIIRNSVFTEKIKKGVFNFQVFYSSDRFIYDKELLGAPGTESLFERSKIIRRNRGRKWFIGLDLQDNLYVNDIFDIIYQKTEEVSLKVIFGYLCSSFVQMLTEGYLQRDITSNIVRELPFPNFNSNDMKRIEKFVDNWIRSEKNLDDFKSLRENIDTLLSEICDFSIDMIGYLKLEVKINWKAL